MIVFFIGLLLNLISSKFPMITEKYYSNGINIYIVKFLSKITSIFPFSLFEILIYMIVLSLITYLIYSITKIVKDYKKVLIYIKSFILNVASVAGLIYFLFIILWGLNYNRMDLKTSLIEDYNKTNNANITEVEYSDKELKELYKFLIERCNEIRLEVSEDSNGVMRCDTNYKGVLSRATNGYDNVDILNLSNRENYATAKPILNSNLLCYTGITGIYSPFTGEANVNIASPDYYIPFTTLHEMAHQRGYASENEANFLAYIAGINHKDYDFKYSSYLLALKYTASSLAIVDYDTYIGLNSALSEDVLNDLTNSSEFWKQYEGKVSEVSDNMNNTYLKANGVKSGTESYGEMVNLLLTYYSLYPKKY